MKWRGLMMIAALMIVSACRSTLPKLEETTTVLPEARPKDLAVAATVFSPRVPLPEENLPRSLKPARYIVEADGVLRAATGESAGGGGAFPPRVRQLTPRQADQLWRLIRDSNLLDEGNPARLSDPETASRSGDRTTAMVYVSWGGERTTLRILLDRSTPDAIEAERLVDRLAELAWIRDSP